MTTPVGGIGVEVHVDATKAAGEVETSMDAALKAMVDQAVKAFEQLETGSSGAGSTVSASLRQAAADAAASMDVLEAKARTAAASQEAAAARLKAAQDQLKAAQNDTTASAADLAAAQDKVDRAFLAAQGSSDKAERAARELANAQNGVQAGLKDTAAAADDAGSSSDGMASKLGDFAGKAAGIGASIAGISTAFEAITEVGDRDALSDKLTAQLGLERVPEMAAEYGRAAANVYSQNWGEGIGEINDAIVALRNNGVLFEDDDQAAVEAMTIKAQALSETFGVDVVDSAQAVRNMVAQGLAPDAASAFDIITRGFQEGANSSDDFLDTLREYSSQFSKLGIDGVEATALISQGLQAGARDGDLVADAFKEFGIRAIDGSKGAADAYEAIGLNADEMVAKIAAGGPGAQEGLQQVLDGLRAMEDPAAQSAAAVGLFGTQAEDLGNALFALDPSKAAGGLGEVAGATDRMATALGDNAPAKLEAFKRGVQQSIVDFVGGTAIPALTSFGSWFSDNKETIAAIAIPIGIVAAGMAALAISSAAAAGGGLAQMVSKLPLVATLTRGWAAAQAFLNAVMAANPFALIVIAIAALVGGLIWAWNNVDGFKEGVLSAWEWIKNATMSAWEGFIKPALEQLGNFFVWVWDTLLRPAFEAIMAYWGLLADAAVWAWQTVLQPTLQALGDFFSWVWTSVLQPVFSGLVAAWTWISDAATWAWTTVLQPTLQALGDFFSWVWTTLLQPVIGAISAGFSAIGSALSWVWTTILQPIFGFLGEAARVCAAIVLAVFVGPLLLAWEGLSAAAGWLWENAISPLFNNFSAIVSWAWNTVIGPIFDFLKLGVSLLGDAFNWLYNVVILPVWNAISAALSFVYDTIIRPMFDAFMAVVRFLGDAFNFVWANVISPVWNALSAGLAFVYDTIIRPIFDGFMRVLTFLGDAFSFAWENVIRPVWDALSDGMSFVYDNVIRPMFDRFQDGLGNLRDAFDRIVTAIGSIWDKTKEIAAAPVRFVIDTVYNKGIKVAVNWVAEKLGLDSLKLPDVTAGFADGGVLPGYTPGRDVHHFTSPTGGQVALSGGEAIMRPEFTRAVGGATGVARLNKQAREGKMGESTAFASGGVLGFGKGGVVDLAAEPWGGGGGESNLKPAAILARRNVHKYWPEVTSIGGYRASDPYPDHPSGLALDIMTSNFITGTDINDWLHQQMGALALNYTIWRQRYQPAGGGGNMMEDRGSPTQNHMDHIHALFNANGVPGIADGGVGGGGGGFISETMKLIANPMEFLKGKFPDAFRGFEEFGGSPWVQAIAKFPGKAIDGVIEKVKGWIGFSGGGDPGGSGVERWREMAKAALARNGFPTTDAVVNAMLGQIDDESDGDPNIAQGITDVNGTGDAAGVGLLQIIPTTWAAHRDPTLPDNRRDPWANMNGVLRYFGSRYGRTEADVLEHWGLGKGGYADGGVFDLMAAYAMGGVADLERFANGAIVDRATVGVFGEAGPEALVPLSPSKGPQRDAVLEAAGLSGGRGSVVIDQVTIEVYGAGDPNAVAEAVSARLLSLTEH